MKRTQLVADDGSVAKKRRYALTDSGDSWVDCFRLDASLRPTRAQFEALWSLHPNALGEIKMLGKTVKTPRWQQSYGLAYKFSGQVHDAQPVPPEVQPYLDWANSLQKEYLAPYGGKRFNMALLNWYQDGQHYIGFHSDDEAQLLQTPSGESLVLSISLGQERNFVLKPRDGVTGETVKLQLSNGTVAVMGGRCQKTHKHAVPKVSGAKGAKMGRRINLTFRLFK